MNLGKSRWWISVEIHEFSPRFVEEVSRSNEFHMYFEGFSWVDFVRNGDEDYHTEWIQNLTLVASQCNVVRVLFTYSCNLDWEWLEAPRLTYIILVLMKFLCFVDSSCDQNQFKGLLPCKLDMLFTSIEDHVKYKN